MKKQKIDYHFKRYSGKVLHARREIPYMLKLSSRLLLDELCYKWNKNQLKKAIDQAIDHGDQKKFHQLCQEYKHFVWE